MIIRGVVELLVRRRGDPFSGMVDLLARRRGDFLVKFGGRVAPSPTPTNIRKNATRVTAEACFGHT
jgi:hypothetical protein